MKPIVHFHLSTLFFTLLFTSCTLVSYSQSVTLVESNGFIEYTITGASDDAHIFTLYGDGTFGSLSSPEHQFKANPDGYTSIVYIVEPYEPILPSSIVSEPTGPLAVGEPIVDNPEMAMDGEIDILSSWAPALGHENFFIIAFRNTSSAIPVNGHISFHYKSDDISVDTTEIKEYNSWVTARSSEAFDLEIYNQKISWNFTGLAYNETRFVYVPAAVSLLPEEGLALKVVYNVDRRREGGGGGGEVSTSNDKNFMFSRDPHDPNFKVVNKSCLGANVAAQRLEYTIGFFNDGNDFAHDVFLSDELSSSLDTSTIVIVDSEYPLSWSLTGSNLSIDFLGIDLPGTNQTTPEAYSYEDAFTYVTFSICTKPFIPYGTCIANEVEIVFDTQPAFITQPAVVCTEQGCLTYEICTGPSFKVQTPLEKTEAVVFSAYPNPVNEEISIAIDFNSEVQAGHDLEILDYTGRVVRKLSRSEKEFTTFQESFYIGNLPKGFYFLTLKTADNTYTQKLLKL